MDEKLLAQLYPELYGEESPAESMSIRTAMVLEEQSIVEQFEEWVND